MNAKLTGWSHVAVIGTLSVMAIAVVVSIRSYLKINLSALGCVVKRIKMLTNDVYAPLFRHFAPFRGNPNLYFEIAFGNQSK